MFQLLLTFNFERVSSVCFIMEYIVIDFDVPQIYLSYQLKEHLYLKHSLNVNMKIFLGYFSPLILDLQPPFFLSFHFKKNGMSKLSPGYVK